MAPLFSKADLNKFWHDVRNEVTLIYAKFGEDLLSISKVIGCKTKWPQFFLAKMSNCPVLSIVLRVGNRMNSRMRRAHSFVRLRWLHVRRRYFDDGRQSAED